MMLTELSDRELLEYIEDLFDNHIIVWKSDFDEEHYEPKGSKQELYQKIYEFRISFHNVMALKRFEERAKQKGFIND